MIITEASRQPEMLAWLCARAGGDPAKVNGMCIGNELNGELVAVTGYDCFTGDTVRIHIAGEGKGNWFSKDFCWYCFYYAFEQLKVKKLIGHVASWQTRALRFDKHLGFMEEEVIEGGAPEGDLHILTMTKDQCRFLRRK
jgi:RimJ/RimL family protein N-acetyltransferase